MRIRSQLVVLVLGTLLPILAFSGIMLVLLNRHTREATEHGLVETARALSVAVDQQVTAFVSVLEALAASEHLRTGDLKAFDRVARRTLATQPTWLNVVLYQPDGRMLVNGQLPFGGPMPSTANPDIVARVFERGTPLVSNLFTGRVIQRPMVMAAVPVIRDGTRAYVLGAALAPKALTDLLLQQKVPSSAIGTLLDRNKVIIARTRAADRFIGQPGTADLAAKMDETAEGAFRLFTKEGQAVYAAISRSSHTGWTIALGVPQTTVDAPLRSSLWLLLAVGAVSTLLGILAAAHGARRIGAATSSLSAAAAALAAGERIDPQPSGITEMDEVARAMATAGEERQRRKAAADGLAIVGRELAGTLDLAQVTSRIVSAVRELFHGQGAALYQVDGAGEALICVAASGQTNVGNWIGRRIAKGEGTSGRVLAEGRVVASASITSDPEIVLPGWASDVRDLNRYDAVTSVPLMRRQRILGVLSLGYESGRVLTEDEQRLLSAFGDQAAVALENARLYQESERRRRAAESLAELGQLISQSLDPQEVGEGVVKSIQTLLAASTAVLFRVASDTGDLIPLTSAGALALAIDGPWDVPAGIGTVGLAVEERRGVLTADVLADPRIDLTPDVRKRIETAGVRAVLAVPVLVRGTVISVLAVAHQAVGAFDAEDVRTAQAFADKAAIALENARLHREVRDRLTESETLLAVGQEVSATLDVTEMMRRVAREAARVLGADMAGAFLATPDHRVLRPIAGYHVPKHLLEEFLAFPIPLKGHRILEAAWTEQRAVAVSNLAAEPGVDQASLERFRHKSNLFCPMGIRGEPVGGLFVTWLEQEHHFVPTELRLVEGICRQAAIAFANARLVEQLKTRQARLQALLVLGNELSRLQPVEPLLTRIAETCGHLFDASSATFTLVEGDALRVCGNWGSAGALLAIPLRVGDSLTGRVAATGEPLLIHDPIGDPRLNPTHRDIYRALDVRAFLGVPVKMNDRVIGVLTVLSSSSDKTFSEEDVELARAFASQAAVAFENSRLYQELQRAFRELSETQDQLVQAQKMEAIGQLAGGIAHDFNNLLTVINGQCYLLAQGLHPTDPSRVKIEIISAIGQRAIELTRQLLAFSRKQVMQPRSLDLNNLVGGMAPMLRRLIGEHIELVIIPGSQLGQVMADPGQIEQVVLNLTVNARDAMPEGGRITIETLSREFPDGVAHAHGRIIPPGAYVALSIEDTGSGIDPKTLTRMFEPFFTTKELGQGTGLGLSTVHGIVHQSGGFIGVDSTVGEGTTFTIYLPRTGAPAQCADDRAGPGTLTRGHETILLVEDEEDVRDLATEVLTACGYTVLETGDPREALRIGEAHRGEIQLLITDMVMPGLRGTALAKDLLSRDPRMRVLYMSGYTGGVIGPQGVIDPAGRLLQKPFTPDVLARTVRDALDTVHAGQ